jgi:hypothetical protein
VKKALFLAFLVVFCCQATFAAPQSRLIARASKDLFRIDSFKIGPAGWMIIPDLLSTSGLKNVAVAGARLHNDSFWLELLGGRAATAKTEEWLFNSRSSLTVQWFQSYGEFQIFPREKKLWWMIQAGYLFIHDKKPICRLGVETENIHQRNFKSELKIGPNLMIPLSEHLTLAGTWYFPNHGQKFFRTYTIINL